MRPEEYICPCCGEELDEHDPVFVDCVGNVIGCCRCIKERQAYEVADDHDDEIYEREKERRMFDD